jgi:hypothetical protein
MNQILSSTGSLQSTAHVVAKCIRTECKEQDELHRNSFFENVCGSDLSVELGLFRSGCLPPASWITEAVGATEPNPHWSGESQNTS